MQVFNQVNKRERERKQKREDKAKYKRKKECQEHLFHWLRLVRIQWVDWKAREGEREREKVCVS